MRVHAHMLTMPSKADHVKAMTGAGLVAYHGMAQHGGGFWGNAWRWAKPIVTGAARAAGASFLKHSKDKSLPDALRAAANDGFSAGQKSLSRQINKSARPF